jgi:RND family efflux transporter MFP subunit
MKPGKAIKQTLLILISLGVLAVVLAYMTGAFHKKIEPGKTEAPKRLKAGEPTDVVHKVIQVQQVEVVGTLRAQRRTEVSARIMARILEMKVRAGDRVKEGDLLARLDDADLKANLERARQAKLEAEANERNAEKDHARVKKMVEEKVASEKEFDDAELRYKSAQAQVKQAREAESAAQTMLSYATIEAPLSGVVVEKLTDVGDTTQPGRPLLTIYDPSVLRLEAAVPEALSKDLQVGAKLKLSLEALDQKQKKLLEGTVAEIVPQADAASRSVLVKVDLPPDAPGQIEGAFGRLMIPDRERVRICVAQSAVREAGQLRFVDVVNPKDNTIERRQVTLGESSPYGRVEALSGLEPNETVVLYGPPPQPLPEGVRLFQEGGQK